MFQTIIGEIRDRIADTVRLTGALALAGIALLITFGFLCAAGFVYVRDLYGSLAACLAGAALFLLIAIAALIVYAILSRAARRRREEAARNARLALLTSPAIIASGARLVRRIGVKKLIPILAIAGLALGLMTGGRSSSDDET